MVAAVKLDKRKHASSAKVAAQLQIMKANVLRLMPLNQ